MNVRKTAVLFIGFVLPAAAQQWEVGGGVGFAATNAVSVTSRNGSSDASMRTTVGYTGVLGQNFHPRWSAELRYGYFGGNPYLSKGSQTSEAKGEKHAIHYDLLYHFADSGQRIRPYVSIGGGGMWHRVSGVPTTQPVALGATFRTGSQLTGVIVPGGGVKVTLKDNLILHASFRDYISTFPKDVIAPGAAGSTSGLWNHFAPMFGISYAPGTRK